LNTIDAWAGTAGERFAPTAVRSTPLGLDLRSGEIRTIVWATGYRPDLSWLGVPVLDRKGRVVHDGGVTACPGLYPIGTPVPRRRADHAPRRSSRRTGRPARKERVMNKHPLATAIAAAVADRDSVQLAAAVTDTVRLRALLPGGPIEEHGRDAVVARFGGWF